MSWAHKPSLNSDLWTDIPLLSKKFLTISGACNNVCVQGFRTTCNGIHMLREGSKYHRWARTAVSLDSQINWVDQDHETTITPNPGFFSLFWQTFHLPSVMTFPPPKKTSWAQAHLLPKSICAFFRGKKLIVWPIVLWQAWTIKVLFSTA